jgi:hypothetical protein
VSRTLVITDEIDGRGHEACLAFHLGPDVQAELNETSAVLSWPGAATPGAGRLELPPELTWSVHQGETDPILGWYSGSFGRRVPAVTLLGRGRSVTKEPFTTRLVFTEAGTTVNRSVNRSAVSLSVSDALASEAPGSSAEAG